MEPKRYVRTILLLLPFLVLALYPPPAFVSLTLLLIGSLAMLFPLVSDYVLDRPESRSQDTIRSSRKEKYRQRKSSRVNSWRDTAMDIPGGTTS